MRMACRNMKTVLLFVTLAWFGTGQLYEDLVEPGENGAPAAAKDIVTERMFNRMKSTFFRRSSNGPVAYASAILGKYGKVEIGKVSDGKVRIWGTVQLIDWQLKILAISQDPVKQDENGPLPPPPPLPPRPLWTFTDSLKVDGKMSFQHQLITGGMLNVRTNQLANLSVMVEVNKVPYTVEECTVTVYEWQEAGFYVVEIKLAKPSGLIALKVLKQWRLPPLPDVVLDDDEHGFLTVDAELKIIMILNITEEESGKVLKSWQFGPFEVDKDGKFMAKLVVGQLDFVGKFVNVNGQEGACGKFTEVVSVTARGKEKF